MTSPLQGEDGKSHVPWPPGSIANVAFIDVTATDWGHGKASSGRQPSYTPTVEGVNESFPVGPNITFTNVSITAPGGGSSSDTYVKVHRLYVPRVYC